MKVTGSGTAQHVFLVCLLILSDGNQMCSLTAHSPALKFQAALLSRRQRAHACARMRINTLAPFQGHE